MKRLVLICCIGALLALPAIAIARPFPPDSHFQGRVEGDPNTYFGFGTTNSKDHKKVRHLAVALPMSCYNGSQGIEQVWIHGHFDLFSFRDLIGLAGAAAPPERTAAIARAKAAAARGRGTSHREFST